MTKSSGRGGGLLELLHQTVASGLHRSSVRRPSDWACRYREMGKPYPGPWSFEHHPWLREMHDDMSEFVVGQKAAQMGYTEWVLNITFYCIDVLAESVLYVLPSESDANDFSASRFDPALELSPHLGAIFSDVRNVALKRAGSASLYTRGSRSRSKLKSLPVGVLIFDEIDEMIQANIPLAMERTSGQVTKMYRMLSTPTIDNYGINEYYSQSTESHFFFPCPACNRLIELTFPDCLEITAESPHDPRIYESHLKCPSCRGRLEHKAKPEFLRKARFVPGYTNRNIKGYHVSQMYSCTLPPHDLAISYLKSLTNPADEQEFYNSKLGLTHSVAGARVLDSEITACTGGYKSQDQATSVRIRTLGIDVGKWLHYCVYEWSFDTSQHEGVDISTVARARLLRADKCLHFEELDTVIRAFRIKFAVIDANPETRKALEFAQRFYGYVRMCYYANGCTGRQISVHDESLHSVSVDRTSWLDVTLSRFRNGTISIPQDVSEEYKAHMKALTRIYKHDKDGNPVGKYVHGNDDDHFAHASNYAEIALALATGDISNADIGSPL